MRHDCRDRIGKIWNRYKSVYGSYKTFVADVVSKKSDKSRLDIISLFRDLLLVIFVTNKLYRIYVCKD